MRSNELLIISIGRKSAFFSFAIGTLLLLAYLISQANNLIPIGLTYIYIAFYVNIAVLFLLLFALVAYSENRNKTWLTILYLLLNIPIAFAYYVIVVSII